MKRVLGFILALCLLSSSVEISNAKKARLNKTKLVLGINVSYRLKIRNTRKKVKWKTSNKKLASVSKKGVIKTKKKGKVTIKAKVGKTTLKCNVTIKEPTLKEKKVNINRYEKRYLNVLYAHKIKWTSSHPQIATINAKGEIEGKRQGDAIITAKADKKTLTCHVKVGDDPKEQGSYIHPNKVKVRSIKVNFPYKKGYNQGGAIYKSEYFLVSSKGDVLVYDFNQNKITKHFSLEQAEEHDIHANSVSFGKKYGEEDPYPLLYVNAYNSRRSPEGTCFIYRLENSKEGLTSSLISTVHVGFTNKDIWKQDEHSLAYGNFLINEDLGKMYVYNLHNKRNLTRFFIFDEPYDNDVTLNQEDILAIKDLPYFPYIQDNCYKNNKIYIVSGGIHHTPPMLRIISVDTMKQVKYLYFKDINLPYEPESIDLYNNKIYIRFNVCNKIQLYELTI